MDAPPTRLPSPKTAYQLQKMTAKELIVHCKEFYQHTWKKNTPKKRIIEYILKKRGATDG
jgi:hypothetical protein